MPALTDAVPAPTTLAEHIARRDGAAFVGREAELRVVDALFRNESGPSVLLVHGPAGIGKSALLREVQRRGRRAGWTPFAADGRVIGAAPSALREALAGAWHAARPLVLLDGVDWAPACVLALRRELLPTLPEPAVVVLASRGRPDDGWFEEGWEALCAALALGPLPAFEAMALLAGRGLCGDPRGPAIARAAGGVPLALREAADAARAEPAWRPGAPAPAHEAADASAVREALRSLRLPHLLARSPLAAGEGIAQRAESVRALIRAAVDDAFGDTHDELLLRRVLVRGYLDPAPSHERAAAELHLSRSSYFRRLRVASERVADTLAGKPEFEFGTVGAVAIDREGDLAAGTSTGGLTNKPVGRIGDSPIIGAGTYANNETAAVSATGTGEFFIRQVVGHELSAAMEYGGMRVDRAARAALGKVEDLGGDGGVIALDGRGTLAMPFNTEGMYRGYVTRDGNVVTKIYGDE